VAPDLQAGSGRRLLACASAGGHFKQLVQLVDRLVDIEQVTWLTHDRGLSREVLMAAGRGTSASETAEQAVDVVAWEA
jgi:hypothetical protein